MNCQACGEKTQRETVLRIGRGFPGGGMQQHHGWYCWNCKISQGLPEAPTETSERGTGLGARLLAALRRDSGWRVPLRDARLSPLGGATARHCA